MATLWPKAVCAIDFGTSRCGYAFSFNDPKNIIYSDFVGQEKTPTCVILTKFNGKYSLRAFGDDAVISFHGLSREDKVNYGFAYFKMELFDEATTLQAQNGLHVPILEVITHSLAFLIHEALEHMYRATTSKVRLNTSEVRWVITVPAIWNDSAKQVMRIAAQDAGLPENLILLALEPEAAALCCRQLRTDLKFGPGCKYIVVDGGGGTVDVAAHEIDARGFTQSITAPLGGAWGSKRIDENFRKLLLEIFGTDLEEDPGYVAEIMDNFEGIKHRFDKRHACATVSVRGIKAVNLTKVNERYASSPIKHERATLELPNKVMCSFYEEVVNEIVTCVKSLNAHTMDYIFLVGGLSESSVLRERMEQIFDSERTKVVTPTHPRKAVVGGAVYFGLNPMIIASRCSAYTYGIETNHKFVNGYHPLHLKKTINGIDWCSKVFSSFVKINEKVPLDHKKSSSVGKLRKEQHECYIPLLTSTNPDDKYITPEMRKVGELIVEVPVDEDVGTYNVEFTMIFGGTEIRAEAKHRITGKKVSCRISFTTKMDFSALPQPQVDSFAAITSNR